MKKKKLIILGVVLFVAIIAVVITVSQAPKWSEISFEAIVQEIVTQSDGETRLSVERTTEIYGSPLNSLAIGEDTELVDKEGNAVSISAFKQGNSVKVTLKNAFVEETPFYYPTVYEIRLID